jgi:hypothetical protein
VTPISSAIDHSEGGSAKELAFVITHRDGAMAADPPLASIDDLLNELDGIDPEHPDVSLSHESGWTLSAFPSGQLLYENVEAAAEVRVVYVDRAGARNLFRALAVADFGTVESQPWTPYRAGDIPGR